MHFSRRSALYEVFQKLQVPIRGGRFIKDLVKNRFPDHYNHLDCTTSRQWSGFYGNICIFVSNSPRNVASKRSLLLILVLRGHSRGTVCQMPLTPLKVKWSLCLMTLSLAASILPQLSVFFFFFPFTFTIFTSSYLHQMAHHSHLPSPAPYISPLPQSLTEHTVKTKTIP